MRQRDEHGAIGGKGPADQIGERLPGQKPVDGEAADEQHGYRLDESKLAIQPRTAKRDLTSRWTPVTATARRLTREAFRDRGHVDMSAELCLVDTDGGHPAEQFATGPAVKGPANLEFRDTGRLTDQHHPVPLPAGGNRRGPLDVSGLLAQTAGEHLAV